MEIFKFNLSGQATITNTQDSINFKVKKGDQIEGTFDLSWCKEGYHVPEFGLSIQGLKGKIKVDDDVVKLEKNSGDRFNGIGMILTIM